MRKRGDEIDSKKIKTFRMDDETVKNLEKSEDNFKFGDHLGIILN